MTAERDAGAPLEPVALALFQNRLDFIAQQMGWVMTRTARSPIFSQSHDFSCFITDAAGRLVSQADGIPIHTGGGGFSVRALVSAFDGDIGPADAFLSNDPYAAGGNHLPDWVVARPVFVDGRLVAFTCNRAHQSDIGGGAAGTYNSAATEIYHEGIRLPALRLIENGRRRDDLWRLLLLNTRMPENLEGDLEAMLGSTRIGADMVANAVARLGVERGIAGFGGILDHGERTMRAALAALPDGEGHGEEGYDDDCFEPADLAIRAAVRVEGERVTVDFTGTDAEVRGFKNSSLANTHSAVYTALVSFLGQDIPKNEGTYRCVDIVAPEGTIVNARPPAAVTMCTVFPAQHIIHAVWKALAPFDPARACAGWGMGGNVNMAWRDARGRTSIMYSWGGSAGGGAVAGRDGFEQIGNIATLGALVLPDAEPYEQMFPVRVLRQEFRPQGAAGAGRWRGGAGVHYAVEVREPAEYSVRCEGTRIGRGFGVCGGRDGSASEIRFTPGDGAAFDAPPYGVLRLGPGRLDIWSCSGGGYGDPLDRPPEEVWRDVKGDLLDRYTAREVYGVVAAADGAGWDDEATTALRRALRQAARPPAARASAGGGA